MAFVNFATREITAKIVYYGPGLGGKTTSLQFIHNNLAPENKGKMISLATEEDRTIYFDFLPLNLGKIQEFAVRVQLYTVPGQVRYNATRKLVLRGADGLVFVADAQRLKKLGNLESFNNMEENLRELGKDLKDLPHVLQFNKMDLPDVMASEEMNQILNRYNVPFFETVATTGIGVLDALKSITKLVFNDLSKKALLQKRSRTTTSLYTAGGTAIDQPLPAAKPATPAASALISPLPFTPASRVATPPPPPPVPEPIHTVEPEQEIKIANEIEEDPLAALEPELPDTLETVGEEPEEIIQEVEPLAEFDEMTDETSALKVSPFHQEPEEPTYDLVADDTEDVDDAEELEVDADAIVDSLGEDDTVVEFQSEPIPIPEPELESQSESEPELEIEPEPEVLQQAEETVVEPSLPPFSYETLFEKGDEFSSLMQTLEKQIAEKKYSDALNTARNGYSHLLTKLYPKQDILDGNEALKIFALDIKFRRFLRFKRLLDSDPDPQNLLYIHHFLCDLYLSLKEL